MTHTTAQRISTSIAFRLCSRALQNQLRCGCVNRQRLRGSDVQSSAEITAGQRRRLPQLVRCAVEHDVAAAFARTGPHVEHPICRQHHLRIVLDDHQRIACRAQPMHHFDHPVHVARMQSDRRFIEHEQRVDQRRAERGRQIDPLHFTAGQRAALPVERQITDADIDQKLQPRAQLVEQHFARLIERRRQLHAIEDILTLSIGSNSTGESTGRAGEQLITTPLRVERL